jgi:hypothetical protein
MKRFSATIFALMMVFAIAGGAMASDMVFMTGSGETYSSRTQLDDVFPDSLLYHDYDGGYYYYSTATNIYSGVRFTAPSEYIVRGFRFMADNPETITDDVVIGVYTNDGGLPGTLLLDAWDGAPTSLVGGWVECQLAEADYLTIADGDDFWVVIGPQPGNGANQWSVVLDQDGAEGDRNKSAIGATATPTGLDNDPVPYDFVVTVGGQYANEFFDLYTVSMFNDIQRFQFDADSTVTFSARVANSGNTACTGGTATFEVLDADDNSVFTTTAPFGAVAASRGDTLLITATEGWTPAADGRYIASVTFDADSAESELGNNSYLLLQEVINHGDWLKYDDGTFETNVSMQAGSGWAVPFHPMAYPAKIDSMSWFFLGDEPNVLLQLYTFDSFGLTLAWELNTAVVQGWNTFMIDDETLPNGINIAEGEFIGVYMFTDDVSFTSDSNPPTCAANPDMPDASYQVQDGNIYLDVSGNWAIRAKVIEGTEPARIQFNFPQTPVMMGDVSVGESVTGYYVFSNDGGLDGTVSGVNLQGNAYDAAEMAFTNTFPMTVVAGTTDSIGFTWTPGENTPGLNAGIFIEHDDPVITSPTFVTTIMGNALGVDVVSTDAIPDNYFLAQNHPNPFNPTTSIQFGLVNAGHVTLTVYNVMGQEVARLVDGQMTAGTYSVTLDGTSLSSGIYFYSLEADGFRSLKKMSLMK